MPDLSSSMADLARQVASERDPSERMQYMVDAAVALVDSCSAAALSEVVEHRRVETTAASSDRARLGDQWQYELGEGPCLEAVWEEPLVHTYDLAQAVERWPKWASKVVEELGFRSMLCLRLYTRGDSMGALNLYAEEPGSFDHDERDQALVLAAHAAAALAASHEIDHFLAGMQRRTVLGQATGVVMERYGLDAHAAFEVLRRISQQVNRKVHDIALELVDRGHAEGL